MKGATEVWGILGGGFGLYGYLPAVAAHTKGPIYTLAHYRGTIRERKDICAYEGRLAYKEDAKAIMAQCNAVIIALRPVDQEAILQEMLDQNWQGVAILEKPVARNPARAIALLERLSLSGINYRVGFTFGVTAWFGRLQEFLAENEGRPVLLEFQWRFLAHHYRHSVDTWKRHPDQGGGALRFYAIHLIALLAKCGFVTPVSSRRATTESGEEPQCQFTVAKGDWRATVLCDSQWSGQQEFRLRGVVTGGPTWEISLDDPLRKSFPGPEGKTDFQVDARVGYLQKIIGQPGETADWDGLAYMKHAVLWEQVERCGGSLEPHAAG